MSPEQRSNGIGDRGKYLLPRDRIIAKIGAYGQRVKCNPSEMDGQQFSSDRSRVFWTPSQDRVLLDLMIEQVSRRAKRGNSFSREAWKHLITRFNRKFSLRYDVQQIKYRLKFYRNHYKVVKSLINQNGFIWDSATHTVKADDSAWEAYLVENPSFVRYRDKEWPYFDDWCKICDSVTAFGQVAITSPLMELEDEPMIDGINGAMADGLADSPMGSPLVFEEEVESSQHPREDDADHMEELNKYSSKPMRSERATRGRRGKAIGLQNALNNIADAMRFRATKRAELNQEKWPVERCIEELYLIEGLEEELFLKSLLAFRDEYNRHVFLSIQGDQRKGWLRMICG